MGDKETPVKEEPVVDSPTSVLEEEDTCKDKVGVKLEEEEFLDAKNGDVSLISSEMAAVEKKLKEENAAEEEEVKDVPELNDSQFSKLDELLTQTHLYTKFLLEKMDDITVNGVEEDSKDSKPNKKGRGSKRKAASNYNTRKAKRAVAAMLTRSEETTASEDPSLTKEEIIEKEQAELVPLLTGGQLKPYQIKGVKWMISFTPSINAIIYHGDAKAREQIRKESMPRSIGPKFPIVVTSYEVAMNDAKKYLRHYSWKYIVVDEGHRLKNSKCKLLKELKHLPVENKLLLTGTPLQNNLAELWSLLNFILPDIFSSHEEFESWFDLSGKCNNKAGKEELEETRQSQVVSKLHAILRPFLLRRMKEDVEQMLPRKKEIILYATMTEYQKNFQEHLVNRTLENHLLETVDTGRGFKGRLQNLMVQLRKNCAHPDLLESAYDGSYFYPPVEQIVGQCGKFQLLDKLLRKLLARKHKVLIFSQWTKILDIMHYYLEESGFEVCRIDGSVKLEERRKQNPQMDLQAMDRCHRIGQTKPVHVYRLATAQSVEGRILKRAFNKLKLEHVVIAKGQFMQEKTKADTADINEEDLLALLRDEENEEDKMIQTDINDEDLEKLLDRSDLMAGDTKMADGKPQYTASVLPLKGPGWEVVIPTSTGGMLNTVNT
uniref:Helicase ATP-binding domain-containing protein n=1 Tax=Daucus carota subsp. sativus TaxID=79200 RepID=A0A164Y5N0_DAUCS